MQDDAELAQISPAGEGSRPYRESKKNAPLRWVRPERREKGHQVLTITPHWGVDVVVSIAALPPDPPWVLGVGRDVGGLPEGFLTCCWQILTATLLPTL